MPKGKASRPANRKEKAATKTLQKAGSKSLLAVFTDKDKLKEDFGVAVNRKQKTARRTKANTKTK